MMHCGASSVWCWWNHTYCWWKKSCTTCDARNVVFTPVSKPFRASQVAHDFFHQPSYHILYIHTLKTHTVSSTSYYQAVLQIQQTAGKFNTSMANSPIVQSLTAGSLQNNNAHLMWAQIQSPVVPVTRSLPSSNSWVPNAEKVMAMEIQRFRVNEYPPSLHRDFVCLCLAYL